MFLLIFSKVYSFKTICSKYPEYSDCLQNRRYNFNLCTILSNNNNDNKNVKKCIKNTIYTLNSNETYNIIYLKCYKNILNINDSEVKNIYFQEKKVSTCLMESEDISYYNNNINCRKINNEIDFKKIYKC